MSDRDRWDADDWHDAVGECVLTVCTVVTVQKKKTLSTADGITSMRDEPEIGRKLLCELTIAPGTHRESSHAFRALGYGDRVGEAIENACRIAMRHIDYTRLLTVVETVTPTGKDSPFVMRWKNGALPRGALHPPLVHYPGVNPYIKNGDDS